MMLVIFNSLPVRCGDIIELVLDLPQEEKPQSLIIRDTNGNVCPYQVVSLTEEEVMVRNKWNKPFDYPVSRFRVKFLAENIPAVGYKSYQVQWQQKPDRHPESMVPADNVMENEYLKVWINPNGSLRIEDKTTGAIYDNLGYFRDQGEVGTGW